MMVVGSSVVQDEKDLEWEDVWANILDEDQGGHGHGSTVKLNEKLPRSRKSWRKDALPYQRPSPSVTKQRQRAVFSKYATLSQYADPVSREDITSPLFDINDQPSEPTSSGDMKRKTNTTPKLSPPPEKSSYRRERGTSPYLRRSTSPSPSRGTSNDRNQSAARFDDFSSRFKRVPTETTPAVLAVSTTVAKMDKGTSSVESSRKYGDFRVAKTQTEDQRDKWPLYAVSSVVGDQDASSRNLQSVESDNSLAEILDKADATLLSSLEREKEDFSFADNKIYLSLKSKGEETKTWEKRSNHLFRSNDKGRNTGLQWQGSKYSSLSDYASPTTRSNFWRRKASDLPENRSERKSRLFSSMKQDDSDNFPEDLVEDDEIGCVDKSKDSIAACILQDSGDDEDENSLSMSSSKLIKIAEVDPLIDEFQNVARELGMLNASTDLQNERSDPGEHVNCIGGSDDAAAQSMRIFDGIARGIDDFLDPDFARSQRQRSRTNAVPQSSLKGGSSSAENESSSSASSGKKYSKERERQRARAHAKSLARVRANKMYSFNDDEKAMNLKFKEALPAISEESEDSTFQFPPEVTESRSSPLKSKLVLRSPSSRQKNLQQMLQKSGRHVRFDDSSISGSVSGNKEAEAQASHDDVNKMKERSNSYEDKVSDDSSKVKIDETTESQKDMVVTLRASSESADQSDSSDSTSSNSFPPSKLVTNLKVSDDSIGNQWNKSLLASYSRQVNSCAMFRMRPARSSAMDNHKAIEAQSVASLFPKTRVFEYDNGEVICKTVSRSFDDEIYENAKNGQLSPTSAQATPPIKEYEHDSGNHMKVVYNHFGEEPEKLLELVEYQAPPVRGNQGLAENSVIIKVEASTVSDVDCALRSGALAKDLNAKLPISPGVDVCGKLFRIDKDASAKYNLKAGDRVMALVKFGGNSRFTGLHPSELVKVPESVDPIEAVCLAENYLSAFQILQCGQSKSSRYRQHSLVGRTVLVSGDVPSILSRAIAKLCPLLGCTNILATTKEKYFDIVTAMGMTPVEAGSESWQTYLRGSVDILIHLGGAMSSSLASKVLRPSGHLVVASSYEKGGLSPPVSIMCSRVLANLASRTYHHNVFKAWATNQKQSHEDLAFLLDLHERRLLVPHVVDRIPLADVAKAHAILGSQRQSGHIVCEPWLKNDTKGVDS